MINNLVQNYEKSSAKQRNTFFFYQDEIISNEGRTTNKHLANEELFMATLGLPQQRLATQSFATLQPLRLA